MMEQLMAETKQEWCECGEPAFTWMRDGKGLCLGCLKAAYQERLVCGQAVLVRRNGRTWAIISLGIGSDHSSLRVTVSEVKSDRTFEGPDYLSKALDYMAQRKPKVVIPCPRI